AIILVHGRSTALLRRQVQSEECSSYLYISAAVTRPHRPFPLTSFITSVLRPAGSAGGPELNLWRAEEIQGGHTAPLRQFRYRYDRGVSLPVLQTADVLLTKAGNISELLLS